MMDVKFTMSKSSVHDSVLVADIIKRVSAYDIMQSGPYPEVDKNCKRAAVLLPLAIHDGQINILLTKRSKRLRSHPSTVAFPGGVRDETDSSDIMTALREAEEEIGLLPSVVQVLGILTRGITLPNTVVYPVVGLIPNDFEPKPNPSEVEFAFYMPLSHFIDEDKVSTSSFSVSGKQYLSRSVDYINGKQSAKVWGFTANYCTLLASIVFNKTNFLPLFQNSEEIGHQGLTDDFVDYFNLVYSKVKLESKL